eukprot:scaffold4007_cov49-Cyclotella_meneghiniana.AAC.14
MGSITFAPSIREELDADFARHMRRGGRQIPRRHHYCKSWVIQDEFPITAQGVVDAFHSLQLEDEPRQILITFCPMPMDEPVRFHHQTFRYYFDFCACTNTLKMHHMVALPYEPKADPSIFKCLANTELRADGRRL